MKRAALFVLIIVGFTVPACKIPPPDSVAGRVISCSTDAVRSDWPKVLGPVNDCLAGQGDAVACLDLVTTTTKVAVDVVACVVRREGSEAHAAAQVNPRNTRDARRSDRARAYIRAKGVIFADDQPLPLSDR